MWPSSFDAQTYLPPVGAQWVYSDSRPSRGWSGRLSLGWTQKPLYVVINDQPISAIDHLLHADFQLSRTLGKWYVVAQLPTKAVYNGPVGLGDLVLRTGIGTETWQVTGSFTVPTSTLSSPLDLSTPHYRATATVSETWRKLKFVGQVTGHYKGVFGVSGSAGIGLWDHVQLETRGEYSDIQLLESSVAYKQRIDDWTVQPSFAVGWFEGPGVPQWRGMLQLSYTPVEPIVVPPVETTPTVETPPPVESSSETPPPVESSPTVASEPGQVEQTPIPPVESTPSPPTESVANEPIVEVPPAVVPAVETPPPLPEEPPLPPEGYSGMGQLADVLRSHPEILLVHLEVHTSCEGSKAQQLVRSQKAADQIKVYLISQGVIAERIEMIARGATQPLVSCPEKTDEGKKKNRRVDARVIEVRQ